MTKSINEDQPPLLSRGAIIKYYLLRWIVCWLAVIDHLIGIFTFGTYCTSMAAHISALHFGRQLEKYSKDTSLINIIRWPNLPWQPGWFYCEAGDCIFVYWSNESYYAKWLNHDTTVYISQETGKPIGVAIYGIGREI